MIRIYCDSNIYRYLNLKHPSFNIKLLEAFEALKDKMLFTFSDAHLHDLKDTPKHYAEADLLLMGDYVKDNYFMHDFITDKKTGPYLATPIEAFSSKNYAAYNQVLNNLFNIDGLLGGLDDFEEGRLLKGMIKSFFNMPIMALGATMEPEKMDSKTKDWFEKFSPNYSPMMSLETFMNDMWPYSKNLLKDKKEVAELRRYISSYMNRNEYSFERWGIEFNEKLKSSKIGKSFIEMIEGMLTGDQKKDLYQKFNYAYTLLEMYNITQERKKFNLESLNTDALHSWYASFSDYLVTNDKGLQIKASIVYQLLGLPTKVLSLQDFINLKSILLGQEETYERFSAAFSYDFEHSFQLYNKEDLFKEEKVITYKTTHPYFNYFNRFQTIQSKESTICAFYCDRESHADFFMYREIELIVNKMIDMLGIDDDNRGRYDFTEKENYESDEKIRRWSKGDIKFTLLTSSKSWGQFPLSLLKL